jgi:hypothetical protein
VVERLPHATVGERVGGLFGHELDELQLGGIARHHLVAVARASAQ